jgi:phenylalanyl-tRNA synthetase beta chain
MKISLNWLKKYLDINVSPEELSEILTMIGLEVEGMDVVEAVKGGLEGVVVGHVIECGKHPNADKLSLTKVDVGGEEPLQIVCGAPNVAAGQKVLVATIGTTLYSPEGEPWKIKKGNIRGEVSEGMICAEDELGLGDNHEGIMVLDSSAKIGISGKQHLHLPTDIVYEIGLTPNRSDATSHIGVASDLAAYLKINHDYGKDVKWPEVSDFKVDMHTVNMKVSVENHEACPRYSGVIIKDLTIKESPDWLKNYLRSVDVRPISNVVDITNFILHEMAQPLHAFDLEEIGGQEIIVKTLPEGSKFLSLDGVERTLSSEDLMICDGHSNPMCIGGVFGGIKSGVKDTTTTIFLEAAHFDSGYIRRSSTRHNLRTDAAKVFEKGSDPSRTVYALKRAALLLQELADGTIVSDIYDIYPHEIERKEIHVKYDNVIRLIGTEISKEEIQQILRAMDMEIEAVDSDNIMVLVPTDKSDVTREVDIIEEILRIYGFNKVPVSDNVTSMVSYETHETTYAFRNNISDILSHQGFNEMMGMSLVESRLYEKLGIIDSSVFVKVNNTSNIHLDIMRPDMMVSGLISVVHNHYRQNTRLRLFEFGKTFQKDKENFREREYFTIFMSGLRNEESWMNDNKAEVDFYDLKKVVLGLLAKLNIVKYQVSEVDDERLEYGVKIHRGPQTLVTFGKISDEISKNMDLKAGVFYAECDVLHVQKATNSNIEVSEISKYPSIRRDLAMVLESHVQFEEIKKVAYGVDKKHIKEVNLFDVYENKEHLGENKKSYAVSFVFRDDNRTLKDKEVEKIISQIIKNLETNIGAEIRN